VFWNYWSETQDILYRVAAAGATFAFLPIWVTKLYASGARPSGRNGGISDWDNSKCLHPIFSCV